MAREPMTLEQIRAGNPVADFAKMASTTEEDIHQHKTEDGEDADATVAPYRATPNVYALRTRLNMTQEAFAKALDVPVADVRDWERAGDSMDAAVRSLLRVVEHEPGMALRALAGYQS